MYATLAVAAFFLLLFSAFLSLFLSLLVSRCLCLFIGKQQFLLICVFILLKLCADKIPLHIPALFLFFKCQLANTKAHEYANNQHFSENYAMAVRHIGLVGIYSSCEAFLRVC